jgi:hypothetical protein
VKFGLFIVTSATNRSAFVRLWENSGSKAPKSVFAIIFRYDLQTMRRRKATKLMVIMPFVFVSKKKELLRCKASHYDEGRFSDFREQKNQRKTKDLNAPQFGIRQLIER